MVPVNGAFSYMLTRGPATGTNAPKADLVELRCDRTEVRPGESVTVHGKEAHPVVIPEKARDGDRLWFELEGGWIDFTVRGNG